MTMFWGQCNACEKRWPLGSPSECTCPQESKWKGLTDEEIKDCEKQAMVNGSLPFEQRSFFARAIEAKLKEKNT